MVGHAQNLQVISLTNTTDTSADDSLPERFDSQLTLEIEDEADGEPLATIRDEDDADAWLTTTVDSVVSLPELR